MTGIFCDFSQPDIPILALPWVTEHLDHSCPKRSPLPQYSPLRRLSSTNLHVHSRLFRFDRFL
ncbi:hypothetical protein FA13DRAFT_1145681 [Coprinellus micaceus]|uniref:Uncharacterized protein n=1 Tax=Coprinellus micaceus TaxID=71717 RepID=A0A4Y7RIB3_COPMI|nr:hypothetical protein FA13DRAFT_1145681 [Coprinellus micaceus]